jgi:hypothetical protein
MILIQKSGHAQILQQNLVVLARTHSYPCFMMMHAPRPSFHTGSKVKNLPACLPGPVHTVLMNAHCYSSNLTRHYYAKLAVQAALFSLPHKTALCGLTVSVALFSVPYQTAHTQNCHL